MKKRKKKKLKIKFSTVFFIVALILLMILVAPYLRPASMVDIGIEAGGVAKANFSLQDISERGAILFSSTVILFLISAILKYLGK